MRRVLLGQQLWLIYPRRPGGGGPHRGAVAAASGRAEVRQRARNEHRLRPAVVLVHLPPAKLCVAPLLGRVAAGGPGGGLRDAAGAAGGAAARGVGARLRAGRGHCRVGRLPLYGPSARALGVAVCGAGGGDPRPRVRVVGRHRLRGGRRPSPSASRVAQIRGPGKQRRGAGRLRWVLVGPRSRLVVRGRSASLSLPSDVDEPLLHARF
mmetsp:Transcript_48452/g.144747  ORF Transcript_48452/g.144747 Transcript_48452/m.144747 type:complete len:209 (+) Transcript_48452:326-952(+)